MENSSINWDIFEVFVGEKIPTCIKLVLNLCGFNTYLSLREIKLKDIHGIQECVDKNFSNEILQLSCCHASFYKSQISHEHFKLLPGHEALVLALPKYVEQFQAEYMKKCIDLKGRYSFVLNELLETAEANKFQSVYRASYSDAVRYFVVYIFLLCGRACYKMLQANLPIPSIPTICKYTNVCN